MILCKETVANIIDVFEDFLESKGVTLKNEDKTGNEGEAIIFGSDYDDIQNSVIDVLKNGDIYIPHSYDPIPVSIERDPYADITIFVPYTGQIIVISEGDGSNLEKEDREEGFVDYAYYSVYDPNDLLSGEIDGGMLCLKEYLRNAHKDIKEIVPDVLSLQYDNENLTWVLLSSINE